MVLLGQQGPFARPLSPPPSPRARSAAADAKQKPPAAALNKEPALGTSGDALPPFSPPDLPRLKVDGAPTSEGAEGEDEEDEEDEEVGEEEYFDPVDPDTVERSLVFSLAAQREREEQEAREHAAEPAGVFGDLEDLPRPAASSEELVGKVVSVPVPLPHTPASGSRSPVREEPHAAQAEQPLARVEMSLCGNLLSDTQDPLVRAPTSPPSLPPCADFAQAAQRIFREHLVSYEQARF